DAPQELWPPPGQRQDPGRPVRADHRRDPRRSEQKTEGPGGGDGQGRVVAGSQIFFSCQWSAVSFQFLDFCFAFKLLPSFVGIPSLSQPPLKLETCHLLIVNSRLLTADR